MGFRTEPVMHYVFFVYAQRLMPDGNYALCIKKIFAFAFLIKKNYTIFVN